MVEMETAGPGLLTRRDLDEFKDEFRRELRREFAPETLTHDVERLRGWQRRVQADGSFGRIMNGPQWIDGVAVRNGVITPEKLVATYVVSNTFTTAEAPADRVQFTSDGIEAYGTVSGNGDTRTLHVENDGSFTFGVAPNAITFDASSGALVVPAATVEDLTIAAIGSGVLGGTYQTDTSGARLAFSPDGLKAFNSSGIETIHMDSSDGSLSLTGTFTLRSASSGSRVEHTSTGSRWYNAGTLRAQILADGSGFLGSNTGLASGAAFSWTSAGTPSIDGQAIDALSIGSSQLASNSVTNAKIGNAAVDTAEIANLAVETAKLGNLAVTNAKVNDLSVGKLTTGTLTSTTITLGSGGSIVDADGSTWTQSGITLVSAGTFGDAIRWRVSGSDKGSITATSTQFFVTAASGASLTLSTQDSLGTISIPRQTNSSVLVASHHSTVDVQLSPASGADVHFGTSATVGGSAANWSSFGTANIPDKSAGYLRVKINNVSSRIPFYADG